MIPFINNGRKKGMFEDISSTIKTFNFCLILLSIVTMIRFRHQVIKIRRQSRLFNLEKCAESSEVSSEF